MIKCGKAFLLVVLGLLCLPGFAMGSTWYVRPDGGTRFSKNVPTGQCDGTADKAYSGKGTNQPCAFKEAKLLWTDGTYTTNEKAGAPSWGWIGAGGDTYLLRGSIGTHVAYPVGQNGPEPNDSFGLHGNTYGAGAPPPPSGTPAQHTRILGENFANCHAASARTQLYGRFGVNWILMMNGASYVDVACLDLTDFSNCGLSGQQVPCRTPSNGVTDYAKNGIAWDNTATNDTLTDVRIHGLADAGMIGPTGDNVVMSYLDLVGNASSGWNADNGTGKTGTGKLLVQHFNISWNGCAEEYPIVDALPYNDCTDDNSGGYGDGFGTATTPSSPAWNATFDQGTASYNTQDGLDALHLSGAGSSMTITHVTAYGNMGQQIKVGGAAGVATDNLIVGNCNALRQAIPGTPAGFNKHLGDFCRASDTALLITVNNNRKLVFTGNTLYTAGRTGVEIECDPQGGGACDKRSTINFRNNIFVGFKNNVADGYPSGGTDEYSNPIYNGSGTTPFTNAGSVYTDNVTFHGKGNAPCPAAGERNASCADPKLPDETWHPYGIGDMTRPAGWVMPPSGPQRRGAAGTEPHRLGRSREAAAYVLGAGAIVAVAWQGSRKLRERS